MRRLWSRRGGRLSGAVAGMISLFALLVVPAASPSLAEEAPSPWPGLPAIDCEHGQYGCASVPFQWAGSPNVGMTGSAPAKQWVRIPLTIVPWNTTFETESRLNPNVSVQRLTILAWFVSPDESENNFGESPLIRVHSVAFGSIPVEVTLQVRQRRDAQGLPRPLEIKGATGLYPLDGDGSGSSPVGYPAAVDEQVDVHIRSLRVDGVDLALQGECTTRSPAALRLTSERIERSAANDHPTQPAAAFDPAHGFLGVNGGHLFGTIDIPAFGGCLTRGGDDLSPLLTATMSGPGNPVDLRVGAARCWNLSEDGTYFVPPGPGQNTPEEAWCWSSPDLTGTAVPGSNVPWPDNLPEVVIVPDPLVFHDEVPEVTEAPELPEMPTLENLGYG